MIVFYEAGAVSCRVVGVDGISCLGEAVPCIEGVGGHLAVQGAGGQVAVGVVGDGLAVVGCVRCQLQTGRDENIVDNWVIHLRIVVNYPAMFFQTIRTLWFNLNSFSLPVLHSRMRTASMARPRSS